MALIGFNAITAGAAGAAVGAAIGSSAGTGAGTTAMQVDIDQAPQLIAGLEAAIEKLQDASRHSDALAATPAPGQDPYSENATDAIRKSAGGTEGGYAWANKKAREALQKTIDNIKQSMQDYSQTDSAARDSLKPKE